MTKIFSLVFILFALQINAQEKITFPSLDGLSITADYYKGLKTRPVILLCHQAGYSRGEYLATAKALQKMGYVCLAIDQRSGGAINGVSNETAALAKQKKLPTEFLNAEQDIEAAIEYCFNRFQKKVVVVGSSYSASLILKLASTNDHIARVVSFSPGDYFNGKIILSDYINKIKIPTFITSSKKESVDITKLLSDANKKVIKQFIPTSEGDHGSKVLWVGDEKNNEYWKAMMLFLKTP